MCLIRLSPNERSCFAPSVPRPYACAQVRSCVAAERQRSRTLESRWPSMRSIRPSAAGISDVGCCSTHLGKQRVRVLRGHRGEGGSIPRSRRARTPCSASRFGCRAGRCEAQGSESEMSQHPTSSDLARLSRLYEPSQRLSKAVVARPRPRERVADGSRARRMDADRLLGLPLEDDGLDELEDDGLDDGADYLGRDALLRSPPLYPSNSQRRARSSVGDDGKPPSDGSSRPATGDSTVARIVTPPETTLVKHTHLFTIERPEHLSAQTILRRKMNIPLPPTESLEHTLQLVFGKTEFRGAQREAMQAALEGSLDCLHFDSSHRLRRARHRADGHGQVALLPGAGDRKDVRRHACHLAAALCVGGRSIGLTGSAHRQSSRDAVEAPGYPCGLGHVQGVTRGPKEGVLRALVQSCAMLRVGRDALRAESFLVRFAHAHDRSRRAWSADIRAIGSST